MKEDVNGNIRQRIQLDRKQVGYFYLSVFVLIAFSFMNLTFQIVDIPEVTRDDSMPMDQENSRVLAERKTLSENEKSEVSCSICTT